MNICLQAVGMASPAGAGGQGNMVQMMMPMLIIFVIFYFMMIRPQQRKEKERKQMIDNSKSGDRIMFGGGLLGIVTNVKDNTFIVKIADNVKIEITKASVTNVIEKGAKIGDEGQMSK